jgi:hypothetical protein
LRKSKRILLGWCGIRHHISTLIHGRGPVRLLARTLGGCPRPCLLGWSLLLATILRQPGLRCGAWSLEAVESRSPRDAGGRVSCFNATSGYGTRLGDRCLRWWWRSSVGPRCRVRGCGREAIDGRGLI